MDDKTEKALDDLNALELRFWSSGNHSYELDTVQAGIDTIQRLSAEVERLKKATEAR
jgi:hypothetical protein